MEPNVLELDTFVRSIRVNRDSPHTMLLGAGASMSSGVPSAGSCIWVWKHSIFCTNNPGLEEQVAELSLPIVRSRIDRWLSNNGYSPANGEDEYCYFIEKCLPIPDDRKRFFEPWVRKARPHVGYSLLCLLAEQETLRSVWTTNFDGLVARAAANFDLTPVEIGIDCQERVFRQPQRRELICVSLHGDYRYDPLKNTAEELQSQEAGLKSALKDTLKTHSLIVSGYSGRDPSVMATLIEAVQVPNVQAKLYWCGFGDEPSEEVRALLVAAKQCGRDAYYVPGAAFDDIMSRLAHHCLEGASLEAAKKVVGKTDSERLVRTPFATPTNNPTAILKSNAWPVTLPTELFEFDLSEWPEKDIWKWTEARCEGHDVVAGPFRRKMLALGTLDGIRKAFSPLIDGEITRVPITEKDLRYEDGVVLGLLRQALVRAIAKKHDLATDGRRVIWKPNRSSTQQEGGKSVDVHDAARLAVRRIDRQMYLTIDPTVEFPNDRGDEDLARNLRLRILGYQHNDKFNIALNDWRGLLLKRGEPTAFDYPAESAAFQFVVRSAPAFAGIRQPQRPPAQLPDKFSRLILHHGIEIPEPLLRFSDASGNTATDTLPLRGLSNKGPFDQSLAAKGIEGRVQVSVICPRAEAPALENFLATGLRTHDPKRGSKEDYLMPYSGFDSVYRAPLSLPGRGDPLWYTLPEVDMGLSEQKGALELSRRIREGVDALSATARSVVLILTPDRWRKFRGFKTNEESFDVHDFVKAHCVQRGIATQFLDQDTFSYQDTCRVWWWLSIALYAKSMRTPWVLQGLDPNTAFVGLGYAIDKDAARGSQIVLGCSHLYNAQGQGLQFRLSRIEDPIIRGRNPFLSLEDARRLGETIRTLFWESHLKLPRRVVIHKQTPFRFDEQQGLKAGLEGVEELELLEINHEASLRYLSSQPKGGKFEEDRFPVRRGSAVQLSNHEALLWIHGATEAAKANWRYFQGKRRIPSPVVLRRYSGTSDLATLGSELLGLSKMDWNSGDLYAKLPATIQSSKRIARIGSLLNRFNNNSYDYRLFM